ASISNVRAASSSWLILSPLERGWLLILVVSLVPAANGRRFTHSMAGSNLAQLSALVQVRHTTSAGTAVSVSPSTLHISAPLLRGTALPGASPVILSKKPANPPPRAQKPQPSFRSTL